MKIPFLAPNERAAVLGFGSIIAVRACGKALGWAGVQTILFKRWGMDRLADSFIWFAILGLLSSLIYIVVADAWKRSAILKTYAGITGILMIVAVLFAPAETASSAMSPGAIPWNMIVFSILVMAACTLGDGTLGIQTWTLINDVFQHHQGVRVYPLLASFHLIGSILGGFLLHEFSKYLPSELLIVLWGLSILAVYPLIEILELKYPQCFLPPAEQNISPSKQHKISHSKRLKTQFTQGIQLAFGSPWLYALSGICVLFWTVASLKEFQYSQIINKEFPTEETLNAYYGLYTIALNVIVLLLQLCYTSSVIARLGVSRCFILLPITIFMGIFATAIFPTLFVAVAMRYTWDVVAMTVQGSSFQLAFNAVPTAFRGRIRGLLEGIINPLGGILGGLLYKFLDAYKGLDASKGLDTSKVNLDSLFFGVAVLGLIFSLIWLLIAIIIPQQYRIQILKNLRSLDPRTRQDAQAMLREFQEPSAMKLQPVQQKQKRTAAPSSQQPTHIPPASSTQVKKISRNQSPMQWAYSGIIQNPTFSLSKLETEIRPLSTLGGQPTKSRVTVPPTATKKQATDVLVPLSDMPLSPTQPQHDPHLPSTPPSSFETATIIQNTPQSCILRKTILAGQADFSLIIYPGRGCCQMILHIEGIEWHSKPRTTCIMIKKQQGQKVQLITVEPGLLYWQHMLGYVAACWQDHQIVLVEIGDYDAEYIEAITIQQNEFKGPYRLKNKGELIRPLARFNQEISRLGTEIP